WRMCAMSRRIVLVLVALSVGGPAFALDPSAPLFPFVLPWNDATAGVPNVSRWAQRPAGALGPVHAGPDGHFYVGNQRIRFLGVNCCFDACFPREDDAARIAAHLAKYGVNVVRFHHMDMFEFPRGIRARGAAGTGTPDPGALDFLDHFIAALE